ncbi:hypothetical protein ACRALDRAFT_211544 [Sodiomyces alcalophilus JCM 7366]|uniref:uncharacterized protein n=1 Tax=Sodiomyces alcalophilus JCM 7366 TaxID=591952 RepID=UPI0039B62A0F
MEDGEMKYRQPLYGRHGYTTSNPTRHDEHQRLSELIRQPKTSSWKQSPKAARHGRIRTPTDFSFVSSNKASRADHIKGGNLLLCDSEGFMAAMADYQEDRQLDIKSAVLPYLAVVSGTILSIFVYPNEVKRPEAFRPSKPFQASPTYTTTAPCPIRGHTRG